MKFSLIIAEITNYRNYNMVLSLYELGVRVKDAVSTCFDEPVWVHAEVSSVRESQGHCYIEFVEKKKEGGQLMAKSRGNIWQKKWSLLRPYFEKTTGQELSAGMQIMVLAEVTFHVVYGMALNIIDINPSFTLGDMARRRREIISILEQEGVKDMNRQLQLPRLLSRIAVISSESAAGWGDFSRQLADNPYSLAFRTRLFPAIMQGERVEESVVAALGAIYEEYEKWDAVVIIRGGGAVSDLTGFDTLLLAENVAQFPLPVITGIGHERDDTVIDMVAHTRVKTPTAAADFIIHHQLNELALVESLTARLSAAITLKLQREEARTERIMGKLPSLLSGYISRQNARLEKLLLRMGMGISRRMEREKMRVETVKKQIDGADPRRVMMAGYSIVRHDGRAVRDAAVLLPHSIIDIQFAIGPRIQAEVRGIEVRDER